MKLTVAGLGYVGLTTAACLADAGNTVFAVDCDSAKIALLNKDIVPFKEPGLDDLVFKNLRTGRLRFSNSLNEGVLNSDVVFITVGTPADENGITDLSQIDSVIGTLRSLIDKHKLIVIKSTVPPGTCNRIKAEMKTMTMTKTEIDCVSNPEFLRQGSAVKDFCNPARIIIGTDSVWAVEILKQPYRPFIRRKTRVIVTDPVSAELAKYASNAMLATRISFMNELSLLCEKIGGDIEHIRRVIGSDPRIGADFLNAGIGYGGSCLPKDIAALINFGETVGCEMAVARAIQKVNANQRNHFVQQISDYFNGRRARVAVWGLAFKAGTDDIRNSAALYCIDELLKRGFEVNAYDPLVSDGMSKIYNGRITISDNRYSVLDGADALVIFTDAPEFRNADLKRVSGKVKVIFDGKNLFEPTDLKQFGIEYHSIGRKICQNFKKSCNISADSASLTYKGLLTEIR